MPHEVCIHPWRFQVEPFRILGNLYYVGNRAVSVHLIDTGAGLVLIDTGYPQTLYLLLESVRRLGFDPNQIEIVLHTHAHYDHVGGARALIELTGARAFLGAADVEIVERRPQLTEADLAGMEFHESFPVARALEDGGRVALGDTLIECVHTPGHTPGAMSYFFEVRDRDKTYVAGIHGGPGLASLTDEFLSRHNLPLSLRQDYLAALSRLRERRVDLHLATHPGQNRTFARRDALSADPLAFADPAAWPAWLDRLEDAWRKRFGGADGPL